MDEEYQKYCDQIMELIRDTEPEISEDVYFGV